MILVFNARYKNISNMRMCKVANYECMCYRKSQLIIYQRRYQHCRLSPSHQFAMVPCSQHRHILIYPNVLYVDGQFANRANHPIALTLQAIQRLRSRFYWIVPADAHTHRFKKFTFFTNNRIIAIDIIIFAQFIYTAKILRKRIVCY